MSSERMMMPHFHLVLYAQKCFLNPCGPYIYLAGVQRSIITHVRSVSIQAEYRRCATHRSSLLGR